MGERAFRHTEAAAAIRDPLTSLLVSNGARQDRLQHGESLVLPRANIQALGSLATPRDTLRQHLLAVVAPPTGVLRGIVEVSVGSSHIDSPRFVCVSSFAATEDERARLHGPLLPHEPARFSGRTTDADGYRAGRWHVSLHGQRADDNAAFAVSHLGEGETTVYRDFDPYYGPPDTDYPAWAPPSDQVYYAWTALQ